MKIVIVGMGNVGQELVAQLAQEGHDLIVVDSVDTTLAKMVNTYDCMAVCGNGASYDVLDKAQAETADLLIACTPQDEVNILCCMVAKKLGAKDTIARVRAPEYFTLFADKDLGLSMMVNPEYETALGIARILRYSSAIKIEPFANGRVDLVEVRITSDTGLVGVRLKDLNQHAKEKFLVCAVERDGVVYIPTGEFELHENDRIHITAPAKSISSLLRNIKGNKQTRNCIIIGGNRIAFYLAKELGKNGVNVKIIEKDAKECLNLCEKLQNVDIIEGDGTDQDLLLDEGLAHSDALICLSDVDEQNILVSTFARSVGVEKVIARVEKRPYYKMLKASDIDSVISGKTSTAEHIVRYARGRQNSLGSSSVNRLYRIVNDQAEALEFTVGSDFEAKNKPLKDVRFKDNVLIATIIRGEEIIIPGGNDAIKEGDGVVLVHVGRSPDDLNQFLE